MQTIEIKGQIYARRNWQDQLEFGFYDFDIGSDWFPVCDHKIVTEIPAGFDPRLAQVAALQAQLEKLRAEFTKRVTEINEQIQSITAIEYTPAQEAA